MKKDTGYYQSIIQQQKKVITKRILVNRRVHFRLHPKIMSPVRKKIYQIKYC